MNREESSRIAHTHHPIKSPIDDDSVRRLLERAAPRGDERILDLGCGGGEWLLRALTTLPKVRAEGVDISEDALTQAGQSAERLGVRDRLGLHQQSAADFTSPHAYDLVLSVGAAHAFGGLLPTLEAAHRHLAPGGHVLIGDGFWDRTPSPEAIDMLGDFADLATTMEQVEAAGWTPVHGHVSSRAELDAYEWSCWGSLSTWALDNPSHPDSKEALALASTRRTEWLRVYRETWGFVSLILRRTHD
ncbi:class I SAM-dependent methyltransferase [Streptomyces sp. NPDC050738]|uniref:SAM-dependent methyltransferase n=1 Tax=Streptomyces sp. NPDC050738 TaxID=3154744 RepID=UPI003440E46D